MRCDAPPSLFFFSLAESAGLIDKPVVFRLVANVLFDDALPFIVVARTSRRQFRPDRVYCAWKGDAELSCVLSV